MSAVRERPIPYSGPMVRARIAGAKTQTRRVVKPTPQMVTDRAIQPWDGEAATLLGLLTKAGRGCPYGQPGDRLWVREAWRTLKAYDGLPPREVPRNAPIWYEADGPAPAWFGRYRNAKFMCRWMSRGLDEVVRVRVERLQDISEADAIAEGIERVESPHVETALWRDYTAGHYGTVSATHSYGTLWESINGAGTWDANLWVWVVEFKRLESST